MSEPRRRFAIVFDFDGTLLPSTPWDSEQELLLLRLRDRELPPVKRPYARLVALADRHRWLGDSFKRHYVRLLRGTRRELLERLAMQLAQRVPWAARQALRELRERGHRLIVATCGTADLSEAVLRASGILEVFEALIGSRFVFADGTIAGMDLSVPSPQAKVEALRRRGLDAESTVAVGDGPTDLPLLQWAGIPVVVEGGRYPPAARLAQRLGGRCTVVRSISQIPEVVRGHGG